MLINRRNAMRLGAGAAAGFMALPRAALAQQKFAGRTLVFATWGGQYQDAQKLAYCDPFEKDTGATVVIDGPVDATRLRVMLESGSTDWHVVCSGEAMMLSLQKDGFLEKIDDSQVDRSRILPEFRYEYGVGAEIGSQMVAYSTAIFDGDVHPRTWADLFDLDTFKGKRMVMNDPQVTFEVALLADGVPKEKLYPLDVDRALKKLDTIKNELLFYTTYAQSQQLISDGAASCGYMYTGRAYTAQQNGAKIGVSWAQNLRDVTPMVVPKGVPNLDMSWAFINNMLEPKNMAVMANVFLTAPANPETLNFIKPEIVPWLATTEEHMAEGIAVDAAYWGENLVSLTERWQNWMLS
jgi:putative spermidine/putrescine transport system substrate-binding protein